MKLECLVETTPELRAHTYLLRENKLIAYRMDTGSVKVFSKPMMFDKKRRSFNKVVDNDLVECYNSSIR